MSFAIRGAADGRREPMMLLPVAPMSLVAEPLPDAIASVAATLSSSVVRRGESSDDGRLAIYVTSMPCGLPISKARADLQSKRCAVDAI